jgi:hypothetical protein
MATWQQLLWHLCGLAHHDPATVVRCAHRCCKMHSGDAPLGHSLSDMFMLKPKAAGIDGVIATDASPGGRVPGFRRHVEDLASGVALQDLPLLFQDHVARLAFIPIVERDMEAKHKDVKHALAGLSHHGPARVSLSIRGEQFGP